MADTDSTAAALAAELTRLVDRVRPWSIERWAAKATGRDGSRSDAGYDLVLTLAQRTPATPPEAVPGRVRDLALADQLAVVGREALRWIDEHDDTALAGELLEQVRATRDALEAAPLG